LTNFVNELSFELPVHIFFSVRIKMRSC